MDGRRRLGHERPGGEGAAGRREPAGPVAAVARPHGRRAWWLAAGAVGMAVAVAFGVSRLSTGPGGVTRAFEIPPGTAERLAAGEDVDVLPASLDLGLRDRLVVVNHDEVVHYLGAFPIAPGQRLDKRFSDAVSLTGYCSLHASGRLSIEVSART